MAKIFRWSFHYDDREDAERQTASLAGQTKSAIENCLLAGRSNCDILVPKLK